MPPPASAAPGSTAAARRAQRAGCAPRSPRPARTGHSEHKVPPSPNLLGFSSGLQDLGHPVTAEGKAAALEQQCWPCWARLGSTRARARALPAAPCPYGLSPSPAQLESMSDWFALKIVSSGVLRASLLISLTHHITTRLPLILF